MFDVGFLEILLIAVIALLVLGPERLPHAARLTGAFISKIRRTVTEVKIELEKEVEYQELQQRVQELTAKSSVDSIERKLNKPFETLPSLLKETLKNDETKRNGRQSQHSENSRSQIEKSSEKTADLNIESISDNEKSQKE